MEKSSKSYILLLQFFLWKACIIQPTIKLKERNGSNIEEEGTDSQMDTWMLFEVVREMPQPESLLHQAYRVQHFLTSFLFNEMQMTKAPTSWDHCKD